jgi:hypothetical protein
MKLIDEVKSEWGIIEIYKVGEYHYYAYLGDPRFKDIPGRGESPAMAIESLKGALIASGHSPPGGSQNAPERKP